MVEMEISEQSQEPSLDNLERIRLNEAVTAVNVESLMPPDWQQQIEEVVKNYGHFVEFHGQEVSTSHESEEFTTGYTVVEGPNVEANLPWLWKLYQGPFRELVEEVSGREMVLDQDPEFGVNINTMQRETQRDGYELHEDANPWTAMLAVTTINKGDGGELVHMLPNGERVETRVQAGMLYIFDGKINHHRVNPLSQSGNVDTRITVPMDYGFPGEPIIRPRNLKRIHGKVNGNGKH